MSPDDFEKAVLSLRGYFGVYGTFGGNPALSPHFHAYCEILRKHVPFNQRGIWCNHPLGKGAEMRRTFDPSVSNLNVHLDREAYGQFKRDWPECGPVGLTTDSRHSPCYVSMKDLDVPEGERWELISKCDINQHWSAGVSMFRNELRAYFCEVAMAQAILHQDEPDYPDTGVKIMSGYGNDGLSDFDLGDGKGVRTQWWRMGMQHFAGQVRQHCHDCSVPLKGHGSLAQAGDRGVEQVSQAHAAVFKPKQLGRKVELVTVRSQLGDPLERMTKYLENVNK